MWSDEKVLLIEKPKKEGEIFEDEYLLLFNFQGLFGPHRRHGGVAQLGEHLPCKQGVMGSNPIISTKSVKTDKEKGSRRKRKRPRGLRAHSSGG